VVQCLPATELSLMVHCSAHKRPRSNLLQGNSVPYVTGILADGLFCPAYTGYIPEDGNISTNQPSLYREALHL
jgi:hypothetical protein